MSSPSPLHSLLSLSFQRSAAMLLFPHAFNTGMGGQLFLEFLYVSPVYDFSNLKVVGDPVHFQWINELFCLHIYILVTLTTTENKHRKLTNLIGLLPLCALR